MYKSTYNYLDQIFTKYAMFFLLVISQTPIHWLIEIPIDMDITQGELFEYYYYIELCLNSLLSRDTRMELEIILHKLGFMWRYSSWHT